MARQRHLSKAPIREAVLDIRIPSQDAVDPDSLRKALGSLDHFPEIHDLKQGSLTLQFSPEGEPETYLGDSVAGVRGTTEDGLWVTQFRQNGMTFSRLAPYPDWDSFSHMARSFAEKFLAVTVPPHVERLALRYVNHFRLPDRDPADYFVALPSFPDSLPLIAGSFLSRVTAYDQETNLSAHVTHALLDDLAPGEAGFILDIDAFTATMHSPRVDQFWGTFDGLRDLKNRIFFELITELNAELHE